MSCKNVCKLCNHLVISQSVAFTGGNLVVTLPAGSYSNGRFAPKGKGSRMGYKPYLYMEDDDWMDEYLNNPEFERNMYRMGYHPDRSDMRMDGMNHKQSRYGESYDRYSENRRHYHDSNDTESKRKMDDSMKEYTSDIIRNLTEMWSDADATLRQSMKTDLTRLIQQMN